MTNYFIEFAIANFILFAIYVLFLQKETNFRFRRGYLLFASLLSLVMPLIKLPAVTQVKQINIINVLPEVLIPTVEITANPISTAATPVAWFEVGYIIIAGLIATRFLVSLLRIYHIYKSSQAEKIEQTRVFTTEEVSSNFTFLNFIFISRKASDIKPEIVLHEKAHVKFGHSFDLILLNLMIIIFWWVPTVWLFLKEIKLVHEYQADDYVINRFDFNTYKTTLITTKLNEHGLYLTNYFNDNQLSKRINTMKNLKLKIRSWKLSMLALSLMMTVYFFACQEQSMTELVSDQNNPALQGEVLTTVDQNAAFPGGMTALVGYISSDLKYPTEAEKEGIEGKVMVEFVTNKDGSVSDVKILRGIGYGCDEEAARVVKNSIKWIPAEHNGTKVRQKMILPISFKLSSDDAAKANSTQVPPPPDLPYDGGMTSFASYIMNNLQYPSEAKEKQIEGKVYVEFIVQPNGKITNTKVLKGIGYGCDEEALRVIKNSSGWLSSNGNEQDEPTKMVIPISFKIPE